MEVHESFIVRASLRPEHAGRELEHIQMGAGDQRALRNDGPDDARPRLGFTGVTHRREGDRELDRSEDSGNDRPGRVGVEAVLSELLFASASMAEGRHEEGMPL